MTLHGAPICAGHEQPGILGRPNAFSVHTPYRDRLARDFGSAFFCRMIWQGLCFSFVCRPFLPLIWAYNTTRKKG
jgi:hypothetical protein